MTERVNVQLPMPRAMPTFGPKNSMVSPPIYSGLKRKIAKAVADTLQAKLRGSEARAIAVQPTENAEAHRLYLLGRFFWNKAHRPRFPASNRSLSTGN